MKAAARCILVIYETESPGPLLLARLAQYDVDLVSSQKFDFKVGPPNLRSYDVFLVYTPRNLRRGHSLCDSLRRLSTASILLIAPIKPPDEACRALQESVDVLLAPDIDPAIAAGHIASLLRCQARHHLVPGEGIIAPLPLYRDQQLEIDLEGRRVKVEGRVIRLTPTEFRFLALLVRHARELLTYGEILNHVWGWGAADHRIVHTFAAQLRTKLGSGGAHYIVNEYGSGYRFSPPE
jgi:DNA-binding response OmpR family regulator